MSEKNRPEDDAYDAFMGFFQDNPRDPEIPEHECTEDHQEGHEVDMPEDLTAVLARALMDTPQLCPSCDDLCIDHTVKIRDAFLLRAHVLSAQLANMTALYSQIRQMGVGQSPELVDKIYGVWEELFLLFPMTEPDTSEQ